jgi:hypothetical protein
MFFGHIPNVKSNDDIMISMGKKNHNENAVTVKGTSQHWLLHRSSPESVRKTIEIRLVVEPTL